MPLKALQSWHVLCVFCLSWTITINSFAMSEYTLELNGGTINLSFAPGCEQLLLSEKDIVDRVSQSASAVEAYFDGFPVSQINIAVNPAKGTDIGGTTYAGEEPLILLRIGRKTTREQLDREWVFVHEMVHLAFPPLHRRHHWIEEGLATYIEPLVRARAGLVDEDYVWKWLLEGVHQGLPQEGDRGLDFTPTWGRVYWGGALFFLQADIQIRQQTNNKYGVEDALRAIIKAGGTLQQDGLWPLQKALKIGDEATGTIVLTELYHAMRATPVETDLTALWDQLGIDLQGKQVIYVSDNKKKRLRASILSGSSQ